MQLKVTKSQYLLSIRYFLDNFLEESLHKKKRILIFVAM